MLDSCLVQLLDGRNIRVDYANKGAKEIRNVQDK